MTVSNEFIQAKENARVSLQKAVRNKEVDAEILSVLDLINQFDEYYTSSSCAGRVVVLELPELGDKQHARFLGKWHRSVDVDEIVAVAQMAGSGQIWLLAQSPIFHIGVCSYKSAGQLVKTAVSCGFKNSGIKSFGRKIVVEVCSTERLDTPIGVDGELLCTTAHLCLLVDSANEVMGKSQEKLAKFQLKLREIYI